MPRRAEGRQGSRQLPTEPQRVESRREPRERAGAEDSAEGVTGSKAAATKPDKHSFPSQNTTSAQALLREQREEPRVAGNTIHPYPVTMKGLRAREGINNLVTVPASTPPPPQNQINFPPSALITEFLLSGFPLHRPTHPCKHTNKPFGFPQSRGTQLLGEGLAAFDTMPRLNSCHPVSSDTSPPAESLPRSRADSLKLTR